MLGFDRYSCRDYLNGYEQSGYCIGTVQVSLKVNEADNADEPEQELHMRGNFLRIRHASPSATNSLILNGFMHNVTYSNKGHVLQLSTLKFNNGNGLVFGSFLGTSGFKDQVESVLNEKGVEADVDDVLYAPHLKFSTCECAVEVSPFEYVVNCTPVLS